MKASLVCIVSAKPDPIANKQKKSQDAGASKILQWIKAPATKFDNQISIPKTYMTQGKSPFLKPVLYTPLSLLHPTLPQTHTQ